MFEPIRGGTRGGQAEFKWSDVSADKDREHYLGHSINAPTGRWQKNKDVHWYTRDQGDAEDQKQAEIQRIKQLEADALAVALGFEPAPKDAAAKELASSASPVKADTEEDVFQRTQDKEDKRRRKAEKKAKKLAKLERKALERGNDPSPYQRRLTRDRSRSRSPRRRDDSRSKLPRRWSREREHLPRPSQSPNRLPDRHSERRAGGDYDVDEREREREKDRRRWDLNARRELPSNRR